MHHVLSLPCRGLLLLMLSAATLFSMAGCVDSPIIGDDIRVIRDTPHYLREAYVYSGKDPISEADEHYRTGDKRLYGAIGFGVYYPGCAPGVGERLAQRHGTILLPDTAGATETDAQEYYRNTALTFASDYNSEMTHLLWSSRHEVR